MTAATSYKETSARMAQLMRELQAKLARHEADFEASGSKDWGYVGDLDYWCGQIDQIVHPEDVHPEEY